MRSCPTELGRFDDLLFKYGDTRQAVLLKHTGCSRIRANPVFHWYQLNQIKYSSFVFFTLLCVVHLGCLLLLCVVFVSLDNYLLKFLTTQTIYLRAIKAEMFT